MAQAKPPICRLEQCTSLVTSLSLHAFRSAEVTVTASWTRLYDQGGLILVMPSPSPEQKKTSWVKTGIEFFNGQCNLSTVATPGASTSDWSLLPLPDETLRVRAQRESKDGQLGPSLWIYLLKDNGHTLAVREITWVRDSCRIVHSVGKLICYHFSSSRARTRVILKNSWSAPTQLARQPKTATTPTTPRNWKFTSAIYS